MNDLPVGRSVDETLRLVQAFQFADQHGEVCPAGWTPGKATVRSLVVMCNQSVQVYHPVLVSWAYIRVRTGP